MSLLKGELLRLMALKSLVMLSFALAGTTYAAPAKQIASESEVCANLNAEFENNEKSFALIHALNVELVQIERDVRDQSEAADRGAGMLRGSRYTADANAKVAKAEDALQKSDDKYKATGDRLTTLLVANECQPPDHITSPETYKTPSP